jgi:1-phosphofructokinase
VRAALADVLVREAAGARWVALSGSLPPGVPVDWYAELTDRLRATGAKVALDTSGEPLLAALATVDARPDQAQRRGARRAHRPARRRPRARPAAAVEAATGLLDRGIGAVPRHARRRRRAARHPRRQLVGHPAEDPRPQLGRRRRLGARRLPARRPRRRRPEDRLRSAVAHGAAAASLPGSTLPTPADVDLAGVSLVRLPDPARTPQPAPRSRTPHAPHRPPSRPARRVLTRQDLWRPSP